MHEDERPERIAMGEDVIDASGSKIGSIQYVVVDPHWHDVSHVVVDTDAIFGRSIVVPIGAVLRFDEHGVTLNVDRDTLQTYPDMIQINYGQPPIGWAPPAGFMYPAGAYLWPVDPAIAGEQASTVGTPAGSVDIDEGMDVISSDGHVVGHVASVEVDPSSGRMAAVQVEHGLVDRHRTRIEVGDLTAMHESGLSLRMTKDDFERLPRS